MRRRHEIAAERRARGGCTAHTTSGKPCRSAPVMGTNVCWHHGGAAPQVKAAAQRRLLIASDPAAAELVTLALDRKKDDRVRLKAINSLLDRAGVVARQSVEVELAPWQGLVDSIVVEQDAPPVTGEVLRLPDAEDESESRERRTRRRQRERPGTEDAGLLSAEARRDQRS